MKLLIVKLRHCSVVPCSKSQSKKTQSVDILGGDQERSVHSLNEIFVNSR